MKLLPITILVLCFSACQPKVEIPKIAFPPNEQTQISTDEAALRIVRKDTQEPVTKDDIRVKRVLYLITDLANDGDSFSLNGKCNLLETSIRVLEDSNGVKVTMQELLEEMKKIKDAGIAETLGEKPTFANLCSLASVKKGK